MKAIGYIRVSTTRQDLERQKKLLKDYCIMKNYTIVDIYSDKQTGATSNREGYIKLLRTDKSIADVIIVSELSRLSREDEIINTLSQINMILRNGLNVVFLDDESKIYKGGSTLALVDIITLSVKAQQAVDERKKIKTRMITGRRAKAVHFRNMFTGGRVPYGYTKVPNPNYKTYVTPKTFLERHPKEAKVIADIYDWIIEGATLREVARKLQENGIKSNLKNDFSATSVLSIVRNPIYKGIWKFQDEEYNGDAIVSETIWEKANYTISNRSLRPTAKQVLHYNPLRGLLKCSCGKSMTIVPVNGNYIFRCSTKKDKYDKVICNNGSINSNLILIAVWKCVKLVVSLSEYINRSGEEISNRQNEIEDINSTINKKNKEIEQITQEQENLVDSLAVVKDTGLRKQIETKYRENQCNIYRLNEEIKRVGERKIGLLQLIEKIKHQADENIIDGLTCEQKRNIYLRELENVSFYSNKRKRGFLVVKFKNGYERIMLLRSRKLPDIFLLPSFFVMDRENCKVEIQTNKRRKTAGIGSKLRIYDSMELEKHFNLTDWDIAKDLKKVK